MIDLNNGSTLTSDRVNEATEALAFGKDRLEAIGQMLCCTDCLHLEKSGLEGFRYLIADVENDIENALKALEDHNADSDDEHDSDDEEAPKNWAQYAELMANYNELNKLYRKTYAENLKLKKELADMKASGGAVAEAIVEAKQAARAVSDVWQDTALPGNDR